MSAQDELGELIERLQNGLVLVGESNSDEGTIELFDTDEATETMAEAAAALTSLIAERDGLRAENNTLVMKELMGWVQSINNEHDQRASRFRARALAAEAQLKTARELADGLNVTDQELVRINNMCVGFDGDVKIWAKMLQKLAVFAISARTALSLDSNKGDGV